jgi:hypothetical protein
MMLFAVSSHTVGFAQRVFLDDFSDGSLTNDVPVDSSGRPVIWTPLDGFNQGTADASSQDLVLTTTSGDGSIIVLPSQDDLTDMSVRTRIRQDGAPGSTAVFARANADVLTAYHAGISTNSGNAFIGRNNAPDPITLISAPTDLDIATEDVMLQFDVVGNKLSLFAWPAIEGESKLIDPTLMVYDDTLSSGIAGVILDNTGAGTTTFHFVEVVAIPEPGSACLCLCGILALFVTRRILASR